VDERIRVGLHPNESLVGRPAEASSEVLEVVELLDLAQFVLVV